MTEHEATEALNTDPVFTDEAANEAEANDPMPPEAEAEADPDTYKAPKPKRKKASATDPANISGRLFAPTTDEVRAEQQRAQDRQVGLLIGPKNLEKMRAFGYDVVLVNQDRTSLTAGIAHRGMTE